MRVPEVAGNAVGSKFLKQEVLKVFEPVTMFSFDLDKEDTVLFPAKVIGPTTRHKTPPRALGKIEEGSFGRIFRAFWRVSFSSKFRHALGIIGGVVVDSQCKVVGSKVLKGERRKKRTWNRAKTAKM